MTESEKKQIVERLVQRLSGGAASGWQDPPSAVATPVPDVALDRLVGAGACRFGVCADQPEQSGFSACELAPPLARMIDHTALKPETTEADIRQLCDEAGRYCFASVCVNPSWVPLAAELLRGSPVLVCTVVGFPLGATQTVIKAAEAEAAVRDGAGEIDMVLHVGMLKSGHFKYVEEDIRAVVTASRRAGAAAVKVILETALLTDREKVIACVLSRNAGADFVKTSTGFSKGGATATDIALMHRVVGSSMGVKASGGVRSKEDAETMIAHGATRIGASASIAIVQGTASASTY
jgi:deoxyribose-phosphate aldolase